MTLQDFIITPIWAFLLIATAYLIRPYVTDTQTRKYFMPGLIIKFFGAITIGFVYQFYYSWGDTFTYFKEARILWNIFLENPKDALRIIMMPTEEVNDLFYLTNRLWTFRSPNNFAMIRILSFMNLFTFNTYSANALIFATFSFSGSWAFYQVLTKKYPFVIRGLALSILFIPSVVIWGSGVFKDTLTFGALMWLSWAFFNYIELKKINFSIITIASISILLIASIKVYIIICFIPICVIWMFLKRLASIKNIIVRFISVPFFMFMAGTLALISAQQAGELNRKYALENLANTAQVTAYDIAFYSGAGGSTYTLGQLDGTWTSMILLAPAGINVSLFRPYLWEVKNPLMFLSAMESLIFLVLTVRLMIFKFKNISRIALDPFFLVCLLFSILFAFAVGVSTFNFGTLVRYKIPLMPFFAVFLILLANQEKKHAT